MPLPPVPGSAEHRMACVHADAWLSATLIEENVDQAEMAMEQEAALREATRAQWAGEGRAKTVATIRASLQRASLTPTRSRASAFWRFSSGSEGESCDEGRESESESESENERDRESEEEGGGQGTSSALSPPSLTPLCLPFDSDESLPPPVSGPATPALPLPLPLSPAVREEWVVDVDVEGRSRSTVSERGSAVPRDASEEDFEEEVEGVAGGVPLVPEVVARSSGYASDSDSDEGKESGRRSAA